MNAKEFYKSYRADDYLQDLNYALTNEVASYSPIHVFEFGCGTGKNLAELNAMGICTAGVDISPDNIAKAIHRHNLPCVVCSDETYLRHLCNFDVVFTCSVLDHIEDVAGIVDELKRIANKAVVIAEATRHDPETYYWKHNYELMGFVKTSFEWTGDDGATYHIWKFEKL